MRLSCLAIGLTLALGHLAPALGKPPPKNTSTIGTPILKPPTLLKPGEYFLEPELAPRGPLVMVVSIPQQLAYVYRNGVMIGASTVSTGKKGHETPTGVFTILQKHADHYSNIYDAAPMPYMQRLTWSGVALHAGRLPGYPASHGCIRLPYDFAMRLYELTSNGMTIVVSDEEKFPSTVAHPGLFAPVDVKGSTTAELSAEGQYAWQPELATEGPVTILVTGMDRRIRVFRNGVQIGWSSYQIDDPNRRLRFHVFTRLDDEAGAAAGDVAPTPRWMLVSDDERVVIPGDRLLEGVSVPGGFLEGLSRVVSGGTTLVVTQLPASGDTTGVDLDVAVAERPAGS
jgi:hypothetical protein